MEKTNRIFQTDRQSQFELLRILSMFMIIAYHFSLWSKFEISVDNLTVNKYWVQILRMTGKIGVNLFVLISGYFSIYTAMRIRKVFKLILQVSFYQIVCFIIALSFGLMHFSSMGNAIKMIAEALFPIPYGSYWFISVYFMIYIMSPFINEFLLKLAQKKHLILIGLLFLIYSVLPTFMKADFVFDQVGWFFFLYIVGAYFRMYSIRIFKKNIYNLCCALGTYILLILSVLVLDTLGRKNILFFNHISEMYLMNNVVVFINSVFLFLFFKNLNIKNKFINLIAGTTFGIYLIHENVYIRLFIWNNLFNAEKYIGSPYFILYSIFVITSVFVVGMLIDLGRIYFVERPFFKCFGNKKIKFTKIKIHIECILKGIEQKSER